MSVVPLRRGGLLALIAGTVFVLGTTLYQGLVLAPAGYLAATAQTSGAHQQFGPFLVWASTHVAVDTGLRLIELVTFVLALWLPGALASLLWPTDRTRFRSSMWIGWAGLGLFIAQIVLTAISTPLLARQFVGQSSAGRGGILRAYIALFTVETVLASVLGGGVLAVFLVLVSLRGSATGRLPGWLAYLGLATAGLLSVSALFALFAPTQPETPTSLYAFLGLSFWLIAIGILLLSVQIRPSAPVTPVPTTTQEAVPPPDNASTT